MLVHLIVRLLLFLPLSFTFCIPAEWAKPYFIMVLEFSQMLHDLTRSFVCQFIDPSVHTFKDVDYKRGITCFTCVFCCPSVRSSTGQSRSSLKAWKRAFSMLRLWLCECWRGGINAPAQPSATILSPWAAACSFVCSSIHLCLHLHFNTWNSFKDLPGNSIC